MSGKPNVERRILDACASLKKEITYATVSGYIKDVLKLRQLPTDRTIQLMLVRFEKQGKLEITEDRVVSKATGNGSHKLLVYEWVNK